MASAALTTPTRLARVSGGITFQPIYTYEERLRQFADLLRSDLLRSSSSPDWPAKGFQVSIEDAGKVRVTHIRREGWHALVTDSSVYFQQDSPDEDAVKETLRVQADLFAKVVARLGIEALNSIGTKFIAVLPSQGKTKVLDQLQALLGLDPRATLLRDRLTATTDVAFRIGYRLPTGSATLQVSADASAESYVVDLDCYSWDTLVLSSDFLEFMLQAEGHFAEDVKAYLAPLVAPVPDRQASPKAAG